MEHLLNHTEHLLLSHMEHLPLSHMEHLHKPTELLPPRRMELHPLSPIPTLATAQGNQQQYIQNLLCPKLRRMLGISVLRFLIKLFAEDLLGRYGLYKVVRGFIRKVWTVDVIPCCP